LIIRSFCHSGRSPCLRARRRYHLAVLLMAGSVLVLAGVLSWRGAALTFPGLGAALPEVCSMRRFLGIECPGCGLTRSFVALAHGDLVLAWHMNPAGPLFFAAIAYQLPYRAYQLRLLSRGRELLVHPAFTTVVILLLAAACLVQWIAKYLAL
jgi:Protein of unknown function (DUF2752)